MPDLRTLISTAMTRHGISQAALAERTGIAQPNISRWLREAADSPSDRIIAAVESLTGERLGFRRTRNVCPSCI